MAKKGKKREDRFEEDSKSGQPFESFYDIGDELGEGGYAFVYRCEHRRTNKTYAVKEVILSKMESGGESTLKDEIAALKMLRGGPHTVRLFDVFEEDNHCFMVMEEMKGGDLLSIRKSIPNVKLVESVRSYLKLSSIVTTSVWPIVISSQKIFCLWYVQHSCV
jgi:serine/threonine protein kinase